MRFTWFNLMPWPYLPDDFRQQNRSVWVDIPGKLYDPRKGHFVYHEYMDQLEYADALGFDGIGVNEHHQNGYGLMPSPNIIAAGLARRTSRAAICVIGNSIALYNPPIRVAEEYAMLDCISGGRLVAGLPLGSPMDVSLCYGVTPMEHRERYREAFALTLKAWQAREIFAWNGRYFQLANVNLWPRPIQQPHPPVWVPGSGSISTFDFAVDNDVCYCFLSYSGAKAAKTMMQGYWDVVAKKGRETNPYRAGFLQLVAVGETDAAAEAKYARHVEYFYHKCLHWPIQYLSPPGNQDYKSLLAAAKSNIRRAEDTQSLRYRDFVEKGYVIAGSAATVRDRIKQEVVKDLRVGNLMVLLQIGSMPHELTLENMDRFAREVLPSLRGEWDDEGWVNHWWPERLRGGTPAPAAAGRP